MSVLIRALVLLLFLVAPALAGWLALPKEWLPQAESRLAVGFGVGFLLLVLVLTPYRMWAAASEKIGELENAAEPRLEISVGESDIYRYEQGGPDDMSVEYRFGVRNKSTSVPIDELMVVFANAVDHNDVVRRDASRQIPSVEADELRRSLNAGDIAYYRLARAQKHQDAIVFCPTKTSNGTVVPKGQYRVKVRISARNHPAIEAYFIVGYADQKVLYLREYGTMEGVGHGDGV